MLTNDILGQENLQTEALNIKLIKAEVLVNNSVGNEWQISYVVDSSILTTGESTRLLISQSKSVTIRSVASEVSETYNDTGNKAININVDNYLDFLDSRFVVDVYVKEGHGRYAGNTAVIRFTYYLSRTTPYDTVTLNSKSYRSNTENSRKSLEVNTFTYDYKNKTFTHNSSASTVVFSNASWLQSENGVTIIFDEGGKGLNMFFIQSSGSSGYYMSSKRGWYQEYILRDSGIKIYYFQ